jgi:hypothetical protein
VNMLSGFEAESELFRGGDCRDDEDAEYEEYLRQEAEKRARVKANAAAGIQPAAAASSTPKPAAPPPQRLVRETLEAEHAERADAHKRRLQVEQRLDTYVADGRSVSNDAPLTPAQLAEQLASNAKAAAEDGALFVQSYR